MRHSKNTAEQPYYSLDEPIVGEDTDQEDPPISVVHGASLPVWKTPSVLPDSDKSARRTSSVFGNTPSGNNAQDSLSEYFPSASEVDYQEIPNARILTEQDSNISWWKRLTSLVAQYSPISLDESEIDRLNLILCGSGVLIALVIFIYIIF